MKFANSMAILPATKAIFGKSKVSFNEIKDHLKSGCILIAEQFNKQIYIYSSHDGWEDYVGLMRYFHHDQTSRNLGLFKILSMHPYNKDTDVSTFDKKLSLYVFK